jgi:S1-C subfamily serine protease
LQVRREHGPASLIRVKAEPPPGNLMGEGAHISGRNPLDGATVADVSPAAAEQLGLDAFTAAGGVLVTKVGPGLAGNLGIRPGDVILGVNGKPTNNVSELRAALTAAGGAWRLTFQRGGRRFDALWRL